MDNRSDFVASARKSRPINSENMRLLWLITPALLIILGVKLVLIDHYGSITPYWDQWDGEGALLYKPFLLGNLSFSELIASHNEHRILFPRILGLIELELLGVWFPALQMVINALLHTATIGFMLWLLLRPLDAIGRAAALFATLVLFSIPFDWGNTLGGFQSPLYLVVGFSLISLKCFQSARAFSVRWFIAALFGIAAYFNMASGALTVLAAIAMCVLQICLGSRSRDRKEFVGLALLAAILAVQLAYVRHIPGHDALGAKGLLDFAGAFLKVAGWPFHPAFAIILNIPAILLLIRLFRDKPKCEAYPWLLIGLFFWLGTQWLTLAYGRAIQPTASRYTDTLILGPVLNVAALAYLTRNFTQGFLLRANGALYRQDGKRVVPAFVTIGLLLALSLIAVASWSDAFQAAAHRGENYAYQTTNLKAFLQTGDIRHLENKPFLHVPYPNPERLASLASDPTIKSILHPGLTGKPLRSDLLLPAWLTHLFRGGLILLLNLGQFLIGIGVGLIIGRGLLDQQTGLQSQPLLRKPVILTT